MIVLCLNQNRPRSYLYNVSEHSIKNWITFVRLRTPSKVALLHRLASYLPSQTSFPQRSRKTPIRSKLWENRSSLSLRNQFFHLCQNHHWTWQHAYMRRMDRKKRRTAWRQSNQSSKIRKQSYLPAGFSDPFFHREFPRSTSQHQSRKSATTEIGGGRASRSQEIEERLRKDTWLSIIPTWKTPSKRHEQ